MNRDHLKKILADLSRGNISTEHALKELENFPYHDLGDAKLDTHRTLRKGYPEVILGSNKSTAQLLKILKAFDKGSENILVTKLAKEQYRYLKPEFKKLKYFEDAKIAVLEKTKVKFKGKGTVLVISAGTSDIPVAEEAYLVSTYMGNRVEKLYDVGVAGIHRLLDNKGLIKKASVIIVVAGMEGALASVVGGLTSKPVIGVPTSVGYGASFGGLSALLGILNTCTPGVVTVNIDNGFGAGYFASLINQK